MGILDFLHILLILKNRSNILLITVESIKTIRLYISILTVISSPKQLLFRLNVSCNCEISQNGIGIKNNIIVAVYFLNLHKEIQVHIPTNLTQPSKVYTNSVRVSYQR